jgi:hypothetical protein
MTMKKKTVGATQVLDTKTGETHFLLDGMSEPDTEETLKRDGLMRVAADGQMMFQVPYHPRVVCWMLGYNLRRVERGLPPHPFIEGHDARILPDNDGVPDKEREHPLAFLMKPTPRKKYPWE